ncbi:hypothetical protein UT300012_21260 [Paraclostridium bifermentans]
MRERNFDIMDEIENDLNPYFTEEEHEDYSYFDKYQMGRMNIDDWDINEQLDDYEDLEDRLHKDVDTELGEFDVINNVQVNKEFIVPEIFMTGAAENLRGEHNSLVNKLLTLKAVTTHKIGKSFLDEPIARNCDASPTSVSAYASSFNQLMVFNIINNLGERMKGTFTLTLDLKGCPNWLREDYIIELLVYVLRLRNFNAYSIKDSGEGKKVVFVCATNLNNSIKEELSSVKTYIKGLVKGEVQGEDLTNYILNLKDLYHMLDIVTFNVKKDAIVTKLNAIDASIGKMNRLLLELSSNDTSLSGIYGAYHDVVAEWLDLFYELGKLEDKTGRFSELPEMLRELGKDEVKLPTIELLTEFSANINNFYYWETVEGKDLLEDIIRYKHKFVDIVVEAYRRYYYGYLDVRANLNDDEQELMDRYISALG